MRVTFAVPSFFLASMAANTAAGPPPMTTRFRAIPTLPQKVLQSCGTPVHGAEHNVPTPRTPPRDIDKGRLSSVATSVRLLKAFSEEQVEIGISDLAKRLGVDKSTVHRLAVTLVADGMLEQNPD